MLFMSRIQIKSNFMSVDGMPIQYPLFHPDCMSLSLCDVLAVVN